MRSSEGKQQQQPYAATPSAEESKGPLPPSQGEGEGGEADSDQGMHCTHVHHTLANMQLRFGKSWEFMTSCAVEPLYSGHHGGTQLSVLYREVSLIQR